MTKNKIFDQTTALILATAIDIEIDAYTSSTDVKTQCRSPVVHRVRLFDRLLNFYNANLTSSDRLLFPHDRPTSRLYGLPSLNAFITQARQEAVNRFPELQCYLLDQQ